jgi:small-conductance mechanosensitive channel
MDLSMLPAWALPLGIVVASVLVGLVAHLVVVRLLSKAAARTTTAIDDLLIAAVRRLIVPWAVLGGLAVAARSVEMSDRVADVVDKSIVVGVILTITMAFSSFVTGLVARHASHAGATFATVTLTQNLARAVIVLLGVLLVLVNLGISIGPLLTMAGVGSLAVALALQPTLSNVFAGFNLALSRTLRVGDYVELEDDRKGWVTDIGWRATTIRDQQNAMIVVPNSRIADMVTINHALPDPSQAVLIDIGVATDSDLDHVERVALELGRQLQRDVRGAVRGHEPTFRFREFGASTIDARLSLRAEGVDAGLDLRSEAIKRIQSRFAQEGIDMPFPHLVLRGAVELDERSRSRSSSEATADRRS